MIHTLSQLLSRTPPRRLSDLEHLLDYMTRLVHDVPSATASTSYYRPPADSELGLECKEAFRVLRTLEADEDFQAFLNEKPKPDNALLGDVVYDALSTLLSSARSPIPSPPEEFDIAGHRVVLRHTPLYFANQINTLLAINRTVGNGIKSDGSVRFDLVLAYYSIIPSNPSTREQWKAVEYNLREYSALWALGHDGDVSDLEHLLSPENDKTIKKVVKQIEQEKEQALFACVVPTQLTTEQETHLNTTPTVLLKWILNRPRNLALGQRIVTELGWYGANDGEDCPQAVKVKLLLRALWLTITPDANSLNNNELKAFIPPAIDYTSIRQSLVNDYQRSLSVSPTAARLALCVLKTNIASEVWVQDIPGELTYGTSSTWVNFKSGFILAEFIAPGSSRHLTFEQLLNLPAEYFRAHSNNVEQQVLVVAAKVVPTLTWAVESGVLPLTSVYSASDIETAVRALEHHESEMAKAAQNLVLKPPSRFRFTSDAEFDQAFRAYLEIPRAAYKTLIKGLLAQYSPLWNGNIDLDEITVYSLREPLHDTRAEHETKRKTDAVRGRAGFVIRVGKPDRNPKYIEMFPGIGIVRLREDIKDLLVGGEVKVETIGSSTRPSRGNFRKGTEQPFDWNAYREAKQPVPNRVGTLIIEQVGETISGVVQQHPVATAPPIAQSPTRVFATNTLKSPRAEALASMIARELFFCDEEKLLEQTRKATRSMDIGRDFLEDISFWGKMFVPFWGPIKELASGDPQQIESGGLGLFTDIVSFGLPIGKYVAGCTRLVVQSGKAGIRLALPRITKLTSKLVTATLQELNPLAAVIPLLKLGRYGLLKLGHTSIRYTRLGIAQLRNGTVATRHMVSVDPAVWSPRQAGDRLFTVAGVPNIPMRNVGTLDAPDYRLINSDSNTTFGPRFREPVTVISNSSPLVRQYAVDPHWITGLKPDSHGIFFRSEYNQKFICNIDEKNTIAVYQIREQGYGYLKETARGLENSFPVSLVNPRTNLRLPLTLSSVKPGHWYSIRQLGGAPDPKDAITPAILLKWSEYSESELNRAMRAFERKYKLDPSAFRQYVHNSNNLAPGAQDILDRADLARTEVTYAHIEEWHTMSSRSRHTLTLPGFCTKHNLDPSLFAKYVNVDGSYRPHGKVLAKHAKNEQFQLLTYEHLNDWNHLYKSNGPKPQMASFVEQNDLNPVIWSDFFKDDGSVTEAGRKLLGSWSGHPSEQRMARKSSALLSEPGTSNRPRMGATPIPGEAPSMSQVPSFGHQINNNAPILQDPNDVTRSLTRNLEGPIADIKITHPHGLFDALLPPARKQTRDAVTDSIRKWIGEEGSHQRKLEERLNVLKLNKGPERGLSVVAKVDIEPFEVIGPYTGKLHINHHSLNAEILEKGKDGAAAVSTFLYETRTKGATLSAHGNSSMLSLINATNVPGAAVTTGVENVRSIQVGHFMVFLIASKKIPAGTELLMDYGPKYWK